MASNLTLFARLVVLDTLLEVEGVTGSQEDVLDWGLSGSLSLFALLVTLRVTNLIRVSLGILFLFFSTGLPLCVAKILVLWLLLLVNSDLNVGEGCFGES